MPRIAPGEDISTALRCASPVMYAVSAARKIDGIDDGRNAHARDKADEDAQEQGLAFAVERNAADAQDEQFAQIDEKDGDPIFQNAEPCSSFCSTLWILSSIV